MTAAQGALLLAYELLVGRAAAGGALRDHATVRNAGAGAAIALVETNAATTATVQNFNMTCAFRGCGATRFSQAG